MGTFDKLLDTIAAASNERLKNRPDHDKDYIGENGFLHCGICGKPLQMSLEVPCVGTRIVTIMCDCDKARREAEEQRLRMEEEQRRIEQMRKIGITSTDYHAMTFASDDGSAPDLTALAVRYVAKRDEMLRENIGLLLHGGTGGGKTFWAAAIANAMIDNGMSAMITTIPRLIKAMSDDFERDKLRILDQIERVRFLVLDDIGFERQTSYAAEKMFEIIDARYRARRPLIVTTNLSLEEIAHPQQMEYQRVFDRIIEMCQPIHVSADGRRKAIARKKSERAREILGL